MQIQGNSYRLFFASFTRLMKIATFLEIQSKPSFFIAFSLRNVRAPETAHAPDLIYSEAVFSFIPPEGIRSMLGKTILRLVMYAGPHKCAGNIFTIEAPLSKANLHSEAVNAPL